MIYYNQKGALYMQKFRIRTRFIDYCVEEQDVCSKFDNDVTIEENSEEYYQAIADEIARIKAELPQKMEFTVECDREDLDEIVCNEISERTGWLIYGFDYDVLR